MLKNEGKVSQFDSTVKKSAHTRPECGGEASPKGEALIRAKLSTIESVLGSQALINNYSAVKNNYASKNSAKYTSIKKSRQTQHTEKKEGYHCTKCRSLLFLVKN
jgi:hypothetical protein